MNFLAAARMFIKLFRNVTRRLYEIPTETNVFYKMVPILR